MSFRIAIIVLAAAAMIDRLTIGAVGQERPGAKMVACPRATQRLDLLWIFTAQNDPKTPRATHTWAVLANCEGGQITSVESISWLPAKQVINTANLHVEPGANLTCAESLHWCRNTGIARVTVWQPLLLRPDVARRFTDRRAFLESGAFGYQCLDFLGEASVKKNGCNCVRALSFVTEPTADDMPHLYGDAAGAAFSQTLLRFGLALPFHGDDAELLQSLGCDLATIGAETQMVRRTVVGRGFETAQDGGALH